MSQARRNTSTKGPRAKKGAKKPRDKRETRRDHAGATPPPPPPPRYHRAPRGAEGEERQCLVTVYDGSDITEVIMASSKTRDLDEEEVAFHWDKVSGNISISTCEGKRIRYFMGIPGVGSVGLAILEDLMHAAGLALSRLEFIKNPKIDPLMSNNAISRRLCELKKAFGQTEEKPSSPEYFITKRDPYRIYWNYKTWRTIEWLDKPRTISQEGESS